MGWALFRGKSFKEQLEGLADMDESDEENVDDHAGQIPPLVPPGPWFITEDVGMGFKVMANRGDCVLRTVATIHDHQFGGMERARAVAVHIAECAEAPLIVRELLNLIEAHGIGTTSNAVLDAKAWIGRF